MKTKSDSSRPVNRETAIKSESTANLIAYYNQHSGRKPIKKFETRAKGEKQCLELGWGVEPEPTGTNDCCKKGYFEVVDGVPVCRECGTPVEEAEGDLTDAELDKVMSKDETPAPEAKEPKKRGRKPSADKPEKVKADTSQTAEKISAAVSKSWEDDTVRSARCTHNRVMVDGVVYGSVYKAFVALELPVAAHIKFRKELKEKKTATYEGHVFEITSEALPKAEKPAQSAAAESQDPAAEESQDPAAEESQDTASEEAATEEAA